MPSQLTILWHWWRLNRNWQRMNVIAAKTEFSHQVLMDICPSYVVASERYNESKRFLVCAGKYITAESLLKQRFNNRNNSKSSGGKVGYRL